MGIISWIVLGLIAGFIGGKLFGKSSGEGWIMDIVLGIVGAVVGGLVFNLFGMGGVSGFNLWSLIVATVGAVIVLWIYHNVVKKRG